MTLKSKKNLDKVFIVAEIGSNHCQDIEIAKDTIQAAKESGADLVKLQHLSINDLYFSPSIDIIELHRKIDVKNEFFAELKEFSDSIGIQIFTAPTYLDAIDFLESVNVDLYKLASAQVATFPQLIDKVARTKKLVLLSTGLSTYSDIEKAIRIINCIHDEYIIMHCNSIYPTPAKDVYLGRMLSYKQMFDSPVGFSDHTLGIHIPIAAVALGARVIEKHFILDKNIDSPDALVSLSPCEFSLMVEHIREVENAIRNKPRINLEESEESFLSKIRYKLILKNSKKTGDGFSRTDFLYRRAETGIDCSLEQLVINNFIAQCDLSEGTLLEFSMLKGNL